MRVIAARSKFFLSKAEYHPARERTPTLDSYCIAAPGGRMPLFSVRSTERAERSSLNDFNDFQESGVTQPSLIPTKILGMSTASSFYVGMLNNVGISYALPSASWRRVRYPLPYTSNYVATDHEFQARA